MNLFVNHTQKIHLSRFLMLRIELVVLVGQEGVEPSILAAGNFKFPVYTVPPLTHSTSSSFG